MARKKQQATTPSNPHGKASRFGQIIGDAFAHQVMNLVREHLQSHHSDYVLLEAEQGRSLVRLAMQGGTIRQIDSVIALSGSRDPVALLESKWLKDARHHNDKGAWILQLREVRKKYPTIRGAAAILAGYWTEGVSVMFRSEGGVKTVVVATDEEVYQSIEQPINQVLVAQNLAKFNFDAKEIRQRLPRADELLFAMDELAKNEQIVQIAKTWFGLQRTVGDQQVISGDLVRAALDELLSPLPERPKILTYEITLNVDSGNVIHYEFRDPEEAMAFISDFAHNPQLIMNTISPKRDDTDSPQ